MSLINWRSDWLCVLFNSKSFQGQENANCDWIHCENSRNLHLAPRLPTGAASWPEGFERLSPEKQNIWKGDHFMKPRWVRWISPLGESWSPISVKKEKVLPPLVSSPGDEIKIKICSEIKIQYCRQISKGNIYDIVPTPRLYELDSENILELISWWFSNISKKVPNQKLP